MERADDSDEDDIDCTMTTMLYAPKLKPHEAAFLKCANTGDIDRMKVLLSKRVNINCVNELDRAAVHFAAASGNDKVLRFLRDSQAEFDVQDKLGMTPIHWAAYYGHVEVVKNLALVQRVRLDLLNKEGMNILHTAAYNGQAGVVEAIKMYIGRLKPSQRDRRGRTPLHLACERGHCEVVRVLLSLRGCNIDAKDNEGRTPLHCAAECGQISVLNRLINFGADLREMDNQNRTALFLAADKGQLAALQAIADIETVPFLIPAFENHNKETLLHVAARRNYYNMIEEFAYRCRVNAYNADGYTALHVAVLANHVESVRVLLRFNANVNLVTYRAQTALHLAVEQNNAGIVFLLLQCPDLHMATPDKKQKTPLYLATQGSFLAITDMFIRTMIKRGVSGKVMQIRDVIASMKVSIASFDAQSLTNEKPTIRQRRFAVKPSACKCNRGGPCVCGGLSSAVPLADQFEDRLASLPTLGLAEYKNRREARCVADDLELRVYRVRFLNGCQLLKRVVRRRYYMLHPQEADQEVEIAAKQQKKASLGLNVFTFFGRIKAAFAELERQGDGNGDVNAGGFDNSNSAATGGKGPVERKVAAAKIMRRSTYRVPDELAGDRHRSKLNCLKRPYVSLDSIGGLYDIFHGLHIYGPSGIHYGLLDRVFYTLSHKLLERSHYDAFAAELGFAPEHAKSIRDQYGDKTMWKTHIYRLLRIWLSTKEAYQYEYIIKDLCRALVAIFPAEQIVDFRKYLLNLEEEYSDVILEHVAKRNKAKEKVIKQWREKAGTQHKLSLTAAKMFSKKAIAKSKSKLAKQPDEPQPASVNEYSSDEEQNLSLSAAITLDSVDMEVEKRGEPWIQSKLETEDRQSVGVSNEALPIEEFVRTSESRSSERNMPLQQSDE